MKFETLEEGFPISTSHEGPNLTLLMGFLCIAMFFWGRIMTLGRLLESGFGIGLVVLLIAAILWSYWLDWEWQKIGVSNEDLKSLAELMDIAKKYSCELPKLPSKCDDLSNLALSNWCYAATDSLNTHLRSNLVQRISDK